MAACSSRTDALDFDSATWKSDLQGCKGDRADLKEQVEEIRLQLLDLREPDIRRLFGKPDAEELLERSNKTYVYFITPGPKCATPGSSAEPLVLKVRVDALGKIKEAAITDGL